MDTTAVVPEYTHTQSGPLCLLLYVPAAVSLVLAWQIGTGPGSNIALASGLALVLVASGFHHLTVTDRGDRLAIRFGPLPLLGRTVRYGDIASAEAGRTQFLDGWGIHYSSRGGWVWNVWGRDCVLVHFKNGGRLWIGTDDAANLAQFLEAKAPAGHAA